MGSMSIWHWLIVGIVVLVLFGRGRISDVMGDFGKGIASFKKGMAEGEKDAAEGDKDTPPRRIEDKRTTTGDGTRERDGSAS